MFRQRNKNETICLQITCGDTAALIRRLGDGGMLIWDIENLDFLTVRLRCAAKDRKAVMELAQKYGADIKVINDGTAFRLLNGLRKRPLISAAFILLTVLALYVPTRVLFVRVDGNVTVPTNLILEEAELCGIRFGASRRLVRSEKMKNALLEAMPQLQWAGVNTSGCVATISVREKTQEDSTEHTVGVGSIVADRDGVIQTCTVQNGTALCRVGEAVVAGQTLVSGYTDCGITIKAVRAQAEITACTIRNLLAVTPTAGTVRGSIIREETKFSLCIGKKLINFFKDSGISDTSCVKMYSEEYLTLPGGFELPVSLVTQKCIYYSNKSETQTDVDSWLSEYCEAYLLDHMLAGQILREHTQLEKETGLCFLHGEYVCLENIGQFVNEEIIEDDG